MINDIRMYSLRYELCSFSDAYGETLFYKEYINDELFRLADTFGNTIEMADSDLSASILVDGSEGLIPEWLRNE